MRTSKQAVSLRRGCTRLIVLLGVALSLCLPSTSAATAQMAERGHRTELDLQLACPGHDGGSG